MTLVYGIYGATSACCSLPLGVSGRKAESGITGVWAQKSCAPDCLTLRLHKLQWKVEESYSILKCSSSAEVDSPRPRAFEVHWRMWFAGVSSVSLDYLRSLSSAFCGFTYRHLIQFSSPVCTTEELNTTFESFCLLTHIWQLWTEKELCLSELRTLKMSSCYTTIWSMLWYRFCSFGNLWNDYKKRRKLILNFSLKKEPINTWVV